MPDYQPSSLGWQAICNNLHYNISHCNHEFNRIANENEHYLQNISPYEKFLDGYSEGLHGGHIDSLKHLQGFMTDRQCVDTQASESMQSYIRTHFTQLAKAMWQEPVPGVWRNMDTPLIPCSHGNWVAGLWHVQPMWSHNIKEASVCKCPAGHQITELSSLSPHFSCTVEMGLMNKCVFTWDLYCPVLVFPSEVVVSNTKCLVYSFGIANEWDFEDGMASVFGCEVHAFDPTTAFVGVHRAHNVEDVHFHYTGLGHTTSTEQTSSTSNIPVQHDGTYGELGGNFLTLGSIVRQLSHEHRRINILKIDCEGCEWRSLYELSQHDSAILDNVCNIYLELHFTTTLNVRTHSDLKYVAFFWEEYIQKRGFKFWFVHTNPGNYYDRTYHEILQKIGFPTHCCIEIAIHNPLCL